MGYRWKNIVLHVVSRLLVSVLQYNPCYLGTLCQWRTRSYRCSDWARVGTTTTTPSLGTTRRPSWGNTTTWPLPCWTRWRSGAGCTICGQPARPWSNIGSRSAVTAPTPRQTPSPPSWKTKRRPHEYSTGDLDCKASTMSNPTNICPAYLSYAFCDTIIR